MYRAFYLQVVPVITGGTEDFKSIISKVCVNHKFFQKLWCNILYLVAEIKETVKKFRELVSETKETQR